MVLYKGSTSRIESGLFRPSVRPLQTFATRPVRPLDYFVGDEPLAAAKRVRFHRLAAEAAVERRDWPVVRSEAPAAPASAGPAREPGALLRLLAPPPPPPREPGAPFHNAHATRPALARTPPASQ